MHVPNHVTIKRILTIDGGGIAQAMLRRLRQRNF